VLDGGFSGWQAGSGEISQSEPDVARGDFMAVPQPERHADYHYAQQAMYSDSVVLCNGLSAESYQEGSIEGSQNLHATSLFEDGDVPYFGGDEVLAEIFEEVGHEPEQEFLSFCGSGYMASINYFAARMLGIENVRMYDGSLVDWEAREGRLFPEGQA
jgi:thiosulfate/3-mercaptopyruvate sulfurtransferase